MDNNQSIEEISLGGGKYTLCIEGFRLWAKRHSEDWLELNNQPGSKMFIAMFYRLQKMEKALKLLASEQPSDEFNAQMIAFQALED